MPQIVWALEQEIRTWITSTTNTIDTAKLDAVVARAIGDLSAGYGGVMVSLGNRLGLYKAMAGAGPLSSREVAKRANCAERYVREWLNSQVAGGYVVYHAISGTYEMTPEQAFVLADEEQPGFHPQRLGRSCFDVVGRGQGGGGFPHRQRYSLGRS